MRDGAMQHFHIKSYAIAISFDDVNLLRP
jgi:hypothetical protein